MLNRRSLITGLISLAAAPAIVRASSLMPVKVIKPTNEQLLNALVDEFYRNLASQADLLSNAIAHSIFYDSQDGFKIKAISDYEFYKGEQWSK